MGTNNRIAARSRSTDMATSLVHSVQLLRRCCAHVKYGAVILTKSKKRFPPLQMAVRGGRIPRRRVARSRCGQVPRPVRWREQPLVGPAVRSARHAARFHGGANRSNAQRAGPRSAAGTSMSAVSASRMNTTSSRLKPTVQRPMNAEPKRSVMKMQRNGAGSAQGSRPTARHPPKQRPRGVSIPNRPRSSVRLVQVQPPRPVERREQAALRRARSATGTEPHAVGAVGSRQEQDHERKQIPGEHGRHEQEFEGQRERDVRGDGVGPQRPQGQTDGRAHLAGDDGQARNPRSPGDGGGDAALQVRDAGQDARRLQVGQAQAAETPLRAEHLVDGGMEVHDGELKAQQPLGPRGAGRVRVAAAREPPPASVRRRRRRPAPAAAGAGSRCASGCRRHSRRRRAPPGRPRRATAASPRGAPDPRRTPTPGERPRPAAARARATGWTRWLPATPRPAAASRSARAGSCRAWWPPAPRGTPRCDTRGRRGTRNRARLPASARRLYPDFCTAERPSCR